MKKQNCDLSDLDDYKYIVLKDLTFPNRFSKTTHIDSIVLSIFGIFIIENREFKGEIIGVPLDKKWEHRTDKRTISFQNPLHKNFKHLKAIEEITGIPFEKLTSVIFFSGDSEFKSRFPKNVLDKDLLGFITNRIKPIFTLDEIIKSVTKINLANLKNTNKDGNKLGGVKKARPDLTNGICPKCGEWLVIREGGLVKSRFIGCSAFPRCLYSKSF